MRTFGEEIEEGGEYIRGKRRGRGQCRADIPAMDGEFKEASMRQGVHGDNAERMIAGLVPILRGEGGEKMREGLPGLSEPGQQVVARTPSASEYSLSHCHPSLPPFLLRVCLPDVWRWGAFRGRGISLQSTGDAERVRIRRPAKMCHDITDFPEGTGAGLGPSVLRQGGQVLL